MIKSGFSVTGFSKSMLYSCTKVVNMNTSIHIDIPVQFLAWNYYNNLKRSGMGTGIPELLNNYYAAIRIGKIPCDV